LRPAARVLRRSVRPAPASAAGLRDVRQNLAARNEARPCAGSGWQTLQRCGTLTLSPIRSRRPPCSRHGGRGARSTRWSIRLNGSIEPGRRAVLMAGREELHDSSADLALLAQELRASCRVRAGRPCCPHLPAASHPPGMPASGMHAAEVRALTENRIFLRPFARATGEVARTHLIAACCAMPTLRGSDTAIWWDGQTACHAPADDPERLTALLRKIEP